MTSSADGPAPGRQVASVVAEETERTSHTARQRLLARAVEWFDTNGVGDTSLGTLSAGLGTSHRVLLSQFGSREGLLTAVMQEVEDRGQEAVAVILATETDPLVAAEAMWTHVMDRHAPFAPVMFELAGSAFQHRGRTSPVEEWGMDAWLAGMRSLFGRAGYDEGRATRLADIGLALGRGLQMEFVLGSDRAHVDAAMSEFLALVRDAASVARGEVSPSA